MSQATLRKLARDYADGILEKEDYRRSRAELLEGILSGEIELQVNEYLPPVVPEKDDVLDITTDRAKAKDVDVEITQFGSADTPVQASSAAATNTGASMPSSDSSDSKKMLVIGGIAAAVIVLIIAIFALLPDSDKPSTTTAANKSESSSTATKNTTTPTASTGRAQKLIQEFLAAKNWSDTNINRFKIQWLSLSQDIRNAAAGTVQWGQLSNAIYKKLLEERALIGLGDDEAVLEKQRKLVGFAEDIGISDPRISLPN